MLKLLHITVIHLFSLLLYYLLFIIVFGSSVYLFIYLEIHLENVEYFRTILTNLV